MSLLSHKLPSDLLALLNPSFVGHLKHFIDKPLKVLALLLEGGVKCLRIPLYIQDFDKITSSSFLSTATMVGWRFLVEIDGQRFALDFRRNEKGQFQFHSYKEGGHIEQMRAKIDALQVSGDYRIADLEVPGLNLMAFWLKPENPSQPSQLCPQDPAPGPFTAGQMYIATDFEKTTHQIAVTQGCTRLLPPPSMGAAIDTNAIYRLTNQLLGPNVALDGIAAFARPAMKAANGGDFQKWKFVSLGGGYYRLQCKAIPTDFGLEGGAKDLGAVMIGPAIQSGQYWRPISVGNDYVNLVNAFTEQDNYALNGGALDAGSLISPAGNSGQNWILTIVP